MYVCAAADMLAGDHLYDLLIVTPAISDVRDRVEGKMMVPWFFFSLCVARGQRTHLNTGHPLMQVVSQVLRCFEHRSVLSWPVKP